MPFRLIRTQEKFNSEPANLLRPNLSVALILSEVADDDELSLPILAPSRFSAQLEQQQPQPQQPLRLISAASL